MAHFDKLKAYGNERVIHGQPKPLLTVGQGGCSGNGATFPSEGYDCRQSPQMAGISCRPSGDILANSQASLLRPMAFFDRISGDLHSSAFYQGLMHEYSQAA